MFEEPGRLDTPQEIKALGPIGALTTARSGNECSSHSPDGGVRCATLEYPLSRSADEAPLSTGAWRGARLHLRSPALDTNRHRTMIPRSRLMRDPIETNDRDAYGEAT